MRKTTRPRAQGTPPCTRTHPNMCSICSSCASGGGRRAAGSLGGTTAPIHGFTARNFSPATCSGEGAHARMHINKGATITTDVQLARRGPRAREERGRVPLGPFSNLDGPCPGPARAGRAAHSLKQWCAYIHDGVRGGQEGRVPAGGRQGSEKGSACGRGGIWTGPGRATAPRGAGGVGALPMSGNSVPSVARSVASSAKNSSGSGSDMIGG